MTVFVHSVCTTIIPHFQLMTEEEEMTVESRVRNVCSHNKGRPEPQSYQQLVSSFLTHMPSGVSRSYNQSKSCCIIFFLMYFLVFIITSESCNDMYV